MDGRVRRIADAVAGGLRRVERRIGAEREGRSAWVWLGPLISVVGTFVLALKVSADGGLGPAAALPLAIVLSLFMGGMSIAYLAAAAADLRDAEAEDGGGGDDGRGPDRPAPAPPRPRRPPVLRWVEVASVRRDHAGDGAAPEARPDREPEPAGGSRRGRR